MDAQMLARATRAALCHSPPDLDRTRVLTSLPADDLHRSGSQPQWAAAIVETDVDDVGGLTGFPKSAIRSFGLTPA